MIADQSAIGCQRITSITSRRPPTTTFFLGGFRRFSVVGKLVVRTVGRREVFVAASKTKLVGDIFVNIVWSATVLRSIGDQSPTSLQWLPIIVSG